MNELETIELIERLQLPRVRATCEYRHPYEEDLKECSAPENVRHFCPSHVSLGTDSYCAYDLLLQRHGGKR